MFVFFWGGFTTHTPNFCTPDRQSAYSLLVKVATGVLKKVCWNNLRRVWHVSSKTCAFSQRFLTTLPQKNSQAESLPKLKTVERGDDIFLSCCGLEGLIFMARDLWWKSRLGMNILQLEIRGQQFPVWFPEKNAFINLELLEVIGKNKTHSPKGSFNEHVPW